MDADRLSSFYRQADMQGLPDPVRVPQTDRLAEHQLKIHSVPGSAYSHQPMYRDIQTYMQQPPQPQHHPPQPLQTPPGPPQPPPPQHHMSPVHPPPHPTHVGHVGKDRSRPRGRMTPYAFFVQERRDYYRRHDIPVEFTAFSKECSALWKELTDEEKGRYQKLSEEDKERFRRETANYCAEIGLPYARDGSRRGRRRKEPGQPKRNMCAFLHFCGEKRPKLRTENPTASIGALAKQLSLAWKVMTPEQKTPYEEMALRDKLRYEQQKQAYEAGYSAGVHMTGSSSSSTGLGASSSLVSGTSGPPGSSSGATGGPSAGVLPRSTYDVAKPVVHHRRKKKDPDMPKRNMSAFMFYSKDQRPHLRAKDSTLRVGQLAQILAADWKLMGPTEKAPYDLMARKDKERYEIQLKAYRKGEYVPNSDQLEIDRLCGLYS